MRSHGDPNSQVSSDHLLGLVTSPVAVFLFCFLGNSCFRLRKHIMVSQCWITTSLCRGRACCCLGLFEFHVAMLLSSNTALQATFL